MLATVLRGELAELYFGTEKRWNEKKNLKALLDIPEELKEYVNDYKINVIEVAWLTDEQLSQFKSDFGIIANFFVQKRKHKDYVPDEREIKHVDEVLKLLSVMTGDNNYEKILETENRKGKKKVWTMCEVLDEWRKRGIDEGKKEGRKESLLNIIQKNWKKEWTW